MKKILVKKDLSVVLIHIFLLMGNRNCEIKVFDLIDNGFKIAIITMYQEIKEPMI